MFVVRCTATYSRAGHSSLSDNLTDDCAQVQFFVMMFSVTAIWFLVLFAYL
jgi:hypothetical protein